MGCALIGLGSNLGDPEQQITQAVAELETWGPSRVSSLYRTEPLGDPHQPWYVNAVLSLDTREAPHVLLKRLQALERRAGRSLRTARWASRVLDLDLLLYGTECCDSPELRLPHPHWRSRRFVLEPLAEIAPDLRDPQTGRTVRELLRTLDDSLRVEKMPPGYVRTGWVRRARENDVP